MTNPRYSKAEIASVVAFALVALASLGFAFRAFVIRMPDEAAQTAHQHAVQQWGNPITGRLVSKGPIQAEGTGPQPGGVGPYRSATYSFSGKFGETQTDADFFSIKDVTPTIQVWQRADTGAIAVANAYDLSGTPQPSPYANAGGTFNNALAGLVGVAVLALIFWWFWGVLRDKIREDASQRRYNFTGNTTITVG